MPVCAPAPPALTADQLPGGRAAWLRGATLPPPSHSSGPNITHTVSAPVQTSAPNNKPESKLTPMDELTVSIEAFKANLKSP